MDRGRNGYARWTRSSLAATLLSMAIVAIGLAATSAASASGTGWTHASMTPIQIGFVPPGQQIFDETTPVYGLRLNLLYGSSKKIGGVDLGLFNDVYTLRGFQLGMGNQVFKKLQGVQLGFANSADSGSGLQIGVMNRTHGLKGLQIGLLNWNDEGFLPVFPLVNFSVGGEH